MKATMQFVESDPPAKLQGKGERGRCAGAPAKVNITNY